MTRKQWNKKRICVNSFIVCWDLQVSIYSSDVSCLQNFMEILSACKWMILLLKENFLRHTFELSKVLKELPSCEIDKIQRIQNTAARIIEGSSHRSPIAPLLQKLHWLPIEKRIKFKIILLTFKLLSGSAPSYLTDLIHTYVPSRSLRSENQHLLQVPRFTTEHYGKRSFAVLAPTLWNNILPLCIRTEPSISVFISKLKTHLFTN